ISLFIIRVPHSKHPLESEIDTSNDFNLTGNNAGSALLDWKTAVKIPWGVLILIGGGLALANGFASTQLDDWIAGQLVFLGQTPHLIIIILAIVTVTIFSGEIISNTATAALFIPITASLAVSLGITPVLLMVPVAVAASYSFIIPISTPP